MFTDVDVRVVLVTAPNYWHKKKQYIRIYDRFNKENCAKWKLKELLMSAQIMFKTKIMCSCSDQMELWSRTCVSIQPVFICGFICTQLSQQADWQSSRQDGGLFNEARGETEGPDQQQTKHVHIFQAPMWQTFISPRALDEDIKCAAQQTPTCSMWWRWEGEVFCEKVCRVHNSNIDTNSLFSFYDQGQNL